MRVSPGSNLIITFYLVLLILILIVKLFMFSSHLEVADEGLSRE